MPLSTAFLSSLNLISLCCFLLCRISFTHALPSAVNWSSPNRDNHLTSSLHRRDDNLPDIRGKRFVYIGFDSSNSKDKQLMEYYEQAYTDSLKLVANQIAVGYTNDVYNEYFAPEGRNKVSAIFDNIQALVGNTRNPTNNIFVTRSDYNELCHDAMACYTDTIALLPDDFKVADNAVQVKVGDFFIHCCDHSHGKYIVSLAKAMSDFSGDVVSQDMSSIADTLVHEYIHWITLSKDILGGVTLAVPDEGQDDCDVPDEIYGEYACRQKRREDSSLVLLNPDSYGWLSIVNYYEKQKPVTGGYKFPNREVGQVRWAAL